MKDLMVWIKKYARVEEESITPENRAPVLKKREKKPPASGGPIPPPNRLSFQGMNTVFKEPIYKMLHKMKGKFFFKWPPKMQGDPSMRDLTSQCSYHREVRYLTEDCRVYKSFLKKLVRDGHLGEFIDRRPPGGLAGEEADTTHKAATIIEVIHACTVERPMYNSFRADLQRVSQAVKIEGNRWAEQPSKRPQHDTEVIHFSDADLGGLVLPHEDALAITLRVDKYDVKRIFVDSASSSEMMYDDLFRKMRFT